MQRRDVLKQAAFAAAASVLPTTALESAQPEDKMPRIVDTHVHLWDLGRFRLPWLEKTSPLARNHVIADFQTAIKGLNVVKGVYMEVDVDPKQHVAEAEYVLDICQKGNTPLVAAVIGG